MVKRHQIITLASIATATMLITAGLGFWYFSQPKPKLAQEPIVVKYWADPTLAAYEPLLEAQFAASGVKAAANGSEAHADIKLVSVNAGGAKPVVGSIASGVPLKLGEAKFVGQDQASVYVVAPLPDKTISGHNLGVLANDLASGIGKQIAAKSWTLKAIGDIIIGREVYMKMLQYGDVLHPFDKFSANLASADYTVGDLENAFSDSKAYINHTGMTFISPFRAAAGLKSSGIDAVNIANNHSFNADAAGYLETISTLDKLGIGHFGGGSNLADSRTPYVASVKGTKVALLGYSSIIGSVAAQESTPGMNYLAMAPWGSLNEQQLSNMEADIRSAKAKSDMVIVYYHWGVEYTHDANDDQRTVAHRAIDAGADIIIGTHPHWVQGVEWYKNHLIAYSLGNFVFDQEWARETKQGSLLNLSFYGNRLQSASLEPYTISDYNQPAPATAEASTQILTDIYAHSWWPK